MDNLWITVDNLVDNVCLQKVCVILYIESNAKRISKRVKYEIQKPSSLTSLRVNNNEVVKKGFKWESAQNTPRALTLGHFKSKI